GYTTCQICRVQDSLEHIILECEVPGQRQVWRLAETLWRLRYNHWPKMNWGLLL
ncbi:hypothetical protein B0H16DRAFT_1225585, partial [Mycena metata]